MKKLYLVGVIGLFSITIFTRSFAQNAVKEVPNSWHMLDYQTDGFYGIGIQKLYQTLLKDKKPKQTVIVAVIDSGIDTTHEDLKSVLWRNPKEIPGNSLDDDGNGYVDDIFGWNFLGGKDGRNVTKDSHEAARVYYKYKKKFGSNNIDESSLTPEETLEFRNYKRAKMQIESQAKDASMYVLFLKNIVEKLPAADSILKIAMGKKFFTGDELLGLKPANPEIARAKNTLLGLFQQTEQMGKTNMQLVDGLLEFYDGEKSKVDALEKGPEDYRLSIVKDNYEDVNDRDYGNNDVMATSSMHGTIVSGIIGAARDNGVGVNGIANDVRIMALRAVPDGDEHDKDIANAIRYAVNNGAQIINMSFGKSFSPEKNWVDDAVRYAQSKGVLLVHAAGNDSKNVDQSEQYPNPVLLGKEPIKADNWITVGASGPVKGELVASFSNYGKNSVDIFAPGVDIYSTLPGGNLYGAESGTSFASPITAAVAALILSYFPDLTPQQIKYSIEKTATPVTTFKVIKPGTEEEVEFAQLSKTGGLINAYEAFKLASTLKGERNQKEEKVLPKPKLKKTSKG